MDGGDNLFIVTDKTGTDQVVNVQAGEYGWKISLLSTYKFAIFRPADPWLLRQLPEPDCMYPAWEKDRRVFSANG